MFDGAAVAAESAGFLDFCKASKTLPLFIVDKGTDPALAIESTLCGSDGRLNSYEPIGLIAKLGAAPATLSGAENLKFALLANGAVDDFCAGVNCDSARFVAV